jgi:cobalt/nickel transport system permease protein
MVDYRMHTHPLDPYSRVDSPLHRLPAAAKLAGAVAVILFIATLPARLAVWLWFPAGLLLAVALLSRIPPRRLLYRLLCLEPLVAGVAILAALGPGGWRAMLLLLTRCTLCLLTMLLLSGTTPFHELLRLLQRLRLPGLLVTTLALMYRYAFLLVDQSQRMRRARQSRTFTAGRWFNWRVLASVLGQLFVRSADRAERIYWAMCARGWR